MKLLLAGGDSTFAGRLEAALADALRRPVQLRHAPDRGEALLCLAQEGFDLALVAHAAGREPAAPPALHAGLPFLALYAAGPDDDVTPAVEAIVALLRGGIGPASRALATAVEATVEAIAILDADGRCRFANAAFASTYGFRGPDEVVGVAFDALVEERERPRLATTVLPAVHGAGRWTGEIQGLRRAGDPFPQELSLTALPDGGIVCVTRDSAGRAQAQQAARETVRVLSGLMDAAPVAIVALSADGIVEYWNRAAERIFGWAAAEVIGQPYPLADPERLHESLRIIEATTRGEPVHDVEVRRRRRDGVEVDVTLSTAPRFDADGRPSGTMAIMVDATARRGSERRLHARERQQAAVAELGHQALGGATPDELMARAVTLVRLTLGVDRTSIFELLPGGRVLQLRAGAGWRADLVGTLSFEATADCQAGLTLLAARPIVVEDVATDPRLGSMRHLDGHEVVSGLSVVVQGRRRPFGVLAAHTRERRVFDSDDVHFLESVANVLGAALERARAEEEQQRLVDLLEATSDFIGIATLDGRVLYLNRSARRVLGLDANGRGETLSSLAAMHPPEMVEMLREVALPVALRDGVWSGENVVSAADGRLLPVSQVIVAHRPAGGGQPILSSILRDVSERKQLEEQLRQAQKMEAIGRLAGGIAHDFNNLLTAIKGHTELLLADEPQGSAARDDLDEIRRSSERAAELTRQLLAFSRRQVLQPRPLNLNHVVRGMEGMLRRLLGDDVVLRTQLAPALGTVRADRGQLEQVLMNLAVNARDAMPDGGTLSLDTADATLDREYASRHPAITPGEYVALIVTDSGCGMDAETRARIFEPFFTTKEPGKGTGLGLSTVYGIVNQSGGHIWVYSEPGRGSTFKIYLPRVADVVAAEPVPAVQPASGEGRETVLVVEDEPAIRALVRKVLQRKGYTVLEAGNGREALRIAELYEDPIHLLFTDVVMPGMSGRALAERLLTSRPRIAVLYTSGYTEDTIVHQGVLDEGIEFLEKPFTPDALARRVREILDRPGAGAGTGTGPGTGAVPPQPLPG
jgi:two-component system, cell cycle sensor histidine kinase and response regulator CckA